MLFGKVIGRGSLDPAPDALDPVPDDHAVGNDPCCQPMAVEDTGPGDGAEAMAGAVQEASPDWAPYQVGLFADFQVSQQTPSPEREAMVTLPPDPPSNPVHWPGDTATLTTEGLELAPATNEMEGLDAESADGVIAA
jgi:hypothetical protein